MGLRRARSVDEDAEWVRQAMFEVNDLRHGLEYEVEDLSKSPAFLDPLESGITPLHDSMNAGAFGREDLPFMDIAAKFSGGIPFHGLLKQINETHRWGLDVEGENV